MEEKKEIKPNAADLRHKEDRFYHVVFFFPKQSLFLAFAVSTKRYVICKEKCGKLRTIALSAE